MPGALAVSLWVHIEHLNLHWSSDIMQHMARGRGKGPWKGCKVGPGKAIACVGGLPWAEGSPPSQLALAFVEPICQPGAAVYHSFQFSHLVVSSSLQLHGVQHTGLSCPSKTPRAYSSSRPWAGDAIHYLILCLPLLLLPSIFPSIRIFSNESVLCIRWPKYWNFSLSISPPNEYSRLIYFTMDWLNLLAIQGTLKSLLQHHSSKASILRCSAFFIVQLSHPYVTTEKP